MVAVPRLPSAEAAEAAEAELHALPEAAEAAVGEQKQASAVVGEEELRQPSTTVAGEAVARCCAMVAVVEEGARQTSLGAAAVEAVPTRPFSAAGEAADQVASVHRGGPERPAAWAHLAGQVPQSSAAR